MYGAFPAKISLQGPRTSRNCKRIIRKSTSRCSSTTSSSPTTRTMKFGMPNFQKASDRYSSLYQLYKTDSTIDLDAELAKLITDLQAIFDQLKPVA